MEKSATVHQGRNGAIYLSLLTGKTILTLRQINDLNIIIPDFKKLDLGKFNKYYNGGKIENNKYA